MTTSVTTESIRPIDSIDATLRAEGPRIRVRFPDRFQGIFARQQPRFEPLLVAARKTLATVDLPKEVWPYYSYGVLEHEQPSFMLLPLMFLAIADYSGGIHRRHTQHLPWLMLSMEACAILDDTVDHTPHRSGRPSYPGRFGAASAAPFSTFLTTIVLEKTFATEPRLMPLVFAMFRDLCALETWEVDSRYPRLETDTLRHWLGCRYNEVTPAVAYGLDSALVLQNAQTLPPRVSVLFAEIFQDVDDLVNFAEQRDRDGENDDLRMGMVTNLLVSTLQADPAIAPLVDRLWSESRTLRSADPTSAPRAPAFNPRVEKPITAAITEHGVPATIAKIVRDAHACIDATPIALRPLMEELVLTFVDRLRRIESLREAASLHLT